MTIIENSRNFIKKNLQIPFIIIGSWAVFQPEGSRIGVLGGRGAPQALHSSVRLYIYMHEIEGPEMQEIREI